MPVATTPPLPSLNGQEASQAAGRDRIEDILIGEPLTVGYKPTIPLWSMWGTDTVPQFYLLRDIELMVMHPVVHSTMSYFKAGVSGAEFDVKSESVEIGQFILEQCQRFWDRGVPQVQNGYEYGWIGCENLYEPDGPVLKWNKLIHFSPRDCYLLTQAAHAIGVRVKQVMDQGQYRDQEVKRLAGNADQPRPLGAVDLWMASGDIPAKGLWYAHNPRFNQYYGQSQLLGAWKPWRRLAWKDAAETVIDGGIYRFAYAGPIARYPEEDLQTPPGAPATTADSQGRPRKYARDAMRQMAEWYKTGAAVGMSSAKYPSDQGGGYKYDLEVPKSTLNVDGLMNYAKYLMDQIRYGVGVPPELMQAAETGSGYSGRSIPLEGFLASQQRLADALLNLFVEQVLRPLVSWNFGPQKFDVKVKNLLETKRKAQGGEAGATPPQQQRMAGPENGIPGQMDQGGQAQNSRQDGWQGPPGPPGFSMNPLVTDSVRMIARRILDARAA